MQSGSTLLVSLDTVPPKGASYASIAAGHEDATILRFLRAMNQAAMTCKLGAIYICFVRDRQPGNLRRAVLERPRAGNGCDYILNGNKTALSALAGTAHSAALQGHPAT